jgi:acyl-CoA thioesterase FadM
MNNGRYLSIMDLGRFDLMLKSKIFWKLFKKGYYPIVTSESIRFKKSFNVFQTFQLVTEMDAWDEKDFYMSQTFVKDGAIYAEGYIKARFRQRGRKESIPTEELFRILGLEYAGVNLSKLSGLQREIENCLVRDKSLPA